MTGNRYYKKDWGESYYIFDSNTISEDEFEERVEYEGYDVFTDSLTGNGIIDLLNENDKLKKALLFYLDIAISESSSNYQNDLDKWCNILFNCDYEEAKRRYGDFKYNERWELDE